MIGCLKRSDRDKLEAATKKNAERSHKRRKVQHFFSRRLQAATYTPFSLGIIEKDAGGSEKNVMWTWALTASDCQQCCQIRLTEAPAEPATLPSKYH